MLDNFRAISVTWDHSTNTIYNNIRTASEDANGRKLVVQVVNGHQLEDLTSVDLRLYWEFDEHKGFDDFELIDEDNGTYEIHFSTDMVSHVGAHKAWLHLVDAEGTVTSEPFTVTVFEGVDADTIQDSNEFSALSNALVAISDLETNYAPRLNSVENNKADKATVNSEVSRLDQKDADLTAQLAQTWKNINSYPKEIGDTSDSQRINRMIAESNNYDTIYLPNQDEPYTIDDTVLFDKALNFRVEGIIHTIGSKDKPALHFVRPNGNQIYINQIRDDNESTQGFDWTNENYIGIFVQSAYKSTIHVEQVTGFSIGVKLQAKIGIGNGGFWFNNITTKRIDNCLIGYELNSDGIDAWFNANEFYETAIGYSSGLATTTVADRYNIKQTLTNGNTYGGNNNCFYNFKFETHGGFGGSHTMVYIMLATDWLFRDCRREVTNRGSNEHEFVLDMSTLKPNITTRYAHSFRNKITGIYNFRIDFINVDTLYGSYTEIIENEPTELSTIYELENLGNISKRLTHTESLLKGHISDRATTSTTLISTNPRFYRANGIKDGEQVVLMPTESLTLYLKDLNVGDTINIKAPSETTRFRVQAYDENDLIIPIVNRLFYGYYMTHSTVEAIENVSLSNFLSITVKDNRIKTLKFYIYGTVDRVTLESTNSNNKIFRNLSPEIFKHNEYYSDRKPTIISDHDFVLGDVVTNTKVESETPTYWQLTHDGTAFKWEDIG